KNLFPSDIICASAMIIIHFDLILDHQRLKISFGQPDLGFPFHSVQRTLPVEVLDPRMTSALSSPGLILPKSGSVPKFGLSTALISLTTTSASDDAPPWFSMRMFPGVLEEVVEA